MPATDFDVVEFAALLRSLPPHLPISDAYEASQLQDSDSRWPTQRLHMTRWFAAQATLGSGQYTRSEPNRSARTTYQRLQSSYGLIWVAEALGADAATLQAAVDEAAAEPDHRRRMGLLRRHLPWDMIAELVTTRLAEQRHDRRKPGRLREQSLNAVRKRLRVCAGAECPAQRDAPAVTQAAPLLPVSVPAITMSPVITGDLKNKIDRVWDAFWSGGISNPMEVIEQITYLLFIRRLDELQTLAESKARVTGEALQNAPFQPGQGFMRWSEFKQVDPEQMFDQVSTQVFPFLKAYGERLGGPESDYSQHMRDARFTIPTPALLAKVVDMLDDIPMANRDTNGDLYEYLLSKLSQSGTNGQFRTPRHIIKLMVDMVAPQPTDTICDPACGTAGFLIDASEYVRDHHPETLTDEKLRQHYHHNMFHGFDFDSTMLRIASMNMLLHGIEGAEVQYRDSLSEGAAGDEESYSLVLANPPFAGSLDYESTSISLQQVVKTKKTELLFLALFLKLLQAGGRAAVIVPDGVLFGSSKAHKTLRKMLVEEQQLDAVVKLPSGVFKPYAGVSTAILFFTKTESGSTEDVWFYDVRSDGFSLDDKRSPVEGSDLPDVLERWAHRKGSEKDRARTDQSFCVPKSEIAEQDYDLSINRYKEIEYDEVEHRPPLDIIADIEALDAEIAQGMADLKAMLG